MSRFTEKMYRNALSTDRGMVTGEPHDPVRHTWGEVHEKARRIAGGLAAAGVGHGDAVGVLAGAPVEIAPTAQGLWMRGASLTMLHQPTPRTDLVSVGAGHDDRHRHDRGQGRRHLRSVHWPRFLFSKNAASKSLTVEEPARRRPDRPRRDRRGRRRADAADVGLDRVSRRPW